MGPIEEIGLASTGIDESRRTGCGSFGIQGRQVGIVGFLVFAVVLDDGLHSVLLFGLDLVMMVMMVSVVAVHRVDDSALDLDLFGLHVVAAGFTNEGVIYGDLRNVVVGWGSAVVLELRVGGNFRSRVLLAIRARFVTGSNLKRSGNTED